MSLASATKVILPSLNPIALFSRTVPLPMCAVPFKIRTDLDCFGAGVCWALVIIDKQNTNNSINIFFIFLIF